MRKKVCSLSSYIFFFFSPLSLTYICLSHPRFLPLSLSWPTCAFSAAIYYLLHIFLPHSPAIWTWGTHFFLPPCIPHHRCLLHLLTHSSWQTPYFLVSPHLRPRFFLISEFLPDWQISIILEDLHKSLPSHFLAEMAFLTICTVSDHTEHSANAALIPIFSADGVKEEWGSLVTFKGWCFHVLSFPQECVFFTLVLLVRGHWIILHSVVKDTMWKLWHVSLHMSEGPDGNGFCVGIRTYNIWYHLFSCDVSPCCVVDVSILPYQHITVPEQELEAESIQVYWYRQKITLPQTDLQPLQRSVQHPISIYSGFG